jgi:hypothetical protein
MSALALCSALRQFLATGEPAASQAADFRRATEKIRRQARFADCCRDNRLAHQRRCDRPDADCDLHRAGLTTG